MTLQRREVCGEQVELLKHHAEVVGVKASRRQSLDCDFSSSMRMYGLGVHTGDAPDTYRDQ